MTSHCSVVPDGSWHLSSSLIPRGCPVHVLIHNRVKGHKQQSSAIAKHYKNVHETIPQGLLERFKVLKKCKNKFDCLVYEKLFIRSLKPNINVQADSIRAKVFL